MLRGFLLLLLDLSGYFRLGLDLLWFGFRSELGVSDGDCLCNIIVGLLVLDEGEPDVQRADVEDDSNGDVEETQQDHQLTGPVEEVKVDGGVPSHPD